VLIDGTPASCVQIGLWHLFPERGPVDVVVSGPNYGRNTTALFSLSSGTVGGALEGAVCGKRAIALSYAFESREHDPDIIAEASEVARRLIERLVRDWPGEEVHFYSVNVPLRKGVREARIIYTDVLQNSWTSGSSFEEVEVDEEVDSAEQEKEIREGERNGRDGGIKEKLVRRKQKRFKWAPKFTDVHESVRAAGPGNDGWAVKEGIIRYGHLIHKVQANEVTDDGSVTPLKANFWHVPGIKGEIKL
jgi:tubulin---tyrosine ligase